MHVVSLMPVFIMLLPKVHQGDERKRTDCCAK